MDRKEFLQNKTQGSERLHYCNSPLKTGQMLDKDLFIVSESIWKFLSFRYKGEEIKRYAIYKNQAGILDRQPHLPMVQVCLVLRDEAIRFPKWLILPRKATFEQIKWILKEVFGWLKEYLDDEIRLWRLHPELKDLDFIEQFNQQLAQKQLPKRMKFPGFSLEKSLKFYVEEYQTYDRFRETLFIEIRKIKTIWLFDLDSKDNKSFDEGAFNTQKHLIIYSNLQQDEQWQTNYTIYYKFHNNTNRDYWDTSYSQEDLYRPFKQQLNWKPLEVQDQKLIINDKMTKDEKEVKENYVNDNISEISDENQQQKTVITSIPQDQNKIADTLTINTKKDIMVKKGEMKKCNNCSKNEYISNMLICLKCKHGFYCNDQCMIRDSRFHEQDCLKHQQSQIEISQQSEQETSQTKGVEVVAQSIDSSIKMISDEEDDDDDDMSGNEFSSASENEIKDKNNDQMQLLIEVPKTRIKKRDEKKEEKSGKIVRDNKKQSNNQNEESKGLKNGKRKKSENDDEIEKGNKRKKYDTSDQIYKFHSSTDKSIITYQETPFKFETIKEKPFQKPRPLITLDMKQTKMASLLTLFSQMHELKDSLTIEQGPLNSIILDCLNKSLDASQLETPLELSYDRLEKHLDLNQAIPQIFRQALLKLSSQNQSILSNFQIKQKFTQICINCSHKKCQEIDDQVIEISNQTDEQLSQQNVKLKIVYIYDYDQYKKYEILLKPGEYSFQEVMQKIKEKVQVDRQSIKMCKKIFVLVDLLLENTMFGQMFQNEGMKFNFRPDQSLTTFAYEISRTYKDKIKKQNFIHIAQTDLEGRILYHLFPRLVLYQDSDQLKNISFKIFKGLRNLIAQSSPEVEQNFMELSENEAYSNIFSNNQTEPYEMVLVLKNGSRWKLDPHQKQKLNQLLDTDMIVRFEAFFPITAKFDDLKAQFKQEFNQPSPTFKDLCLKDLNSCLRKHIRQCIVGGDVMKDSCDNCKEKKGAQQVTELVKLSTYIALQVSKVDKSHSLQIPMSISLDKYLSKTSSYYQSNNANEYEFFGAIGSTAPPIVKDENVDDGQNGLYAIIYNPKEMVWYQYKYGKSPQSQSKAIDIKENDELINQFDDQELEFIIYKRSRKEDINKNNLLLRK